MSTTYWKRHLERNKYRRIARNKRKFAQKQAKEYKKVEKRKYKENIKNGMEKCVAKLKYHLNKNKIKEAKIDAYKKVNDEKNTEFMDIESTKKKSNSQWH
jgi:hypothetical protein